MIARNPDLRAAPWRVAGRAVAALAAVGGMGVRAAREGLVVLAVDAEVHVTKQVFRANEVNLVGGGGTDMRVGIEAAARLRPPFRPMPRHLP